MKATKFSAVLLAGLLVGGMASGCKTKKGGMTPLPGGGNIGLSNGDLGQGNRLGSGDPFSDGLGSGPIEPGGGEAAAFDPDQMNQDREALAAYTIYFGYDSYSVSPGERSKLDAVAAALRTDPSARLLIEGHCDERGTEEYNRSLGDRRALSARESLAGLGVEPGRVATRTYGEDRPADPGQGEAAWAKNRRAEFILLHPR